MKRGWDELSDGGSDDVPEPTAGAALPAGSGWLEASSSEGESLPRMPDALPPVPPPAYHPGWEEADDAGGQMEIDVSAGPAGYQTSDDGPGEGPAEVIAEAKPTRGRPKGSVRARAIERAWAEAHPASSIAAGSTDAGDVCWWWCAVPCDHEQV